MRSRSGRVANHCSNWFLFRPLLWLLSLAAAVSLRGQQSLSLKGLIPATLDYRPFQSPVKNQASRGTCTTFSVAAVMETFDGVPADLS